MGGDLGWGEAAEEVSGEGVRSKGTESCGEGTGGAVRRRTEGDAHKAASNWASLAIVLASEPLRSVYIGRAAEMFHTEEVVQSQGLLKQR